MAALELDPTSRDLGSWSRRRLADGVLLVEPEGRARLRLRPRVAGARLSALLDQVAENHGVRVPAVIDRRRLIAEGELGVIAMGRLDDGRELAMTIVGDGPCACIDAVGDPEVGLASRVESLALAIGSGRGARRVRMFEYEPPAGWRGLRRDAATLWLSPTTPKATAMITVHDARPLALGADDRLHRRLFLRLVDRDGALAGEPWSVTSGSGLHGRVYETRIPRAGLIRRAAAFGDDGFLYQATLEARADDLPSLATFDQLIQSFRPLPLALGSEALVHWAD
jgi:hypothetical protein